MCRQESKSLACNPAPPTLESEKSGFFFGKAVGPIEMRWTCWLILSKMKHFFIKFQNELLIHEENGSAWFHKNFRISFHLSKQILSWVWLTKFYKLRIYQFEILINNLLLILLEDIIRWKSYIQLLEWFLSV